LNPIGGRAEAKDIIELAKQLGCALDNTYFVFIVNHKKAEETWGFC